MIGKHERRIFFVGDKIHIFFLSVDTDMVKTMITKERKMSDYDRRGRRRMICVAVERHILDTSMLTLIKRR